MTLGNKTVFVNKSWVPAHGVARRDLQNQNGIMIPNQGYYVRSGSLTVQGGLSGSVEFQFDAFGLKLKRFEIFHSGAASSFDVLIENKSPNSGSDYDPRRTIVEYNGIVGSGDFSSGLDQIEDMVALTDQNGKIYLKVLPNGAGNNWFLYILFFEGAIVYVGREGEFS